MWQVVNHTGSTLHWTLWVLLSSAEIYPTNQDGPNQIGGEHTANMKMCSPTPRWVRVIRMTTEAEEAVWPFVSLSFSWGAPHDLELLSSRSPLPWCDQQMQTHQTSPQTAEDDAL